MSDFPAANYGIVYKSGTSYIINDGSYQACPAADGLSAITSEMVEAYLADHPEALVPEPVPPPPTPEQIAAQRKAEIMRQLAEIDAKSIRPIRAKETARISELEAEAKVLRDELGTL